MTLFWANHFVVEFDTVSGVNLFCINTTNCCEDYAFGNFKDFVKEITLNSAMLKYLNGEKNRAGLQTKIMQGTSGIIYCWERCHGNPPYTEDDVKLLQRVLTGWRNDLVGTSSANGFNSYF